MAIYPPNNTRPQRGLNYVWNFLSSSMRTFAQALCPYIQQLGCTLGVTPSITDYSLMFYRNGVADGTPDMSYAQSNPDFTGMSLDSFVSVPHDEDGFGQSLGYSVWHQDNYVFVVRQRYTTDWDGVYITVYDKVNFSYVTEIAVSDFLPSTLRPPTAKGYSSLQLFGDGTYLYLGINADQNVPPFQCCQGGLIALRFNVSTQTISFVSFNDQYSLDYDSNIWGDGNYVYAVTTSPAGTNTGKITAYKVVNNVLTVAGRYTPLVYGNGYGGVYCQNGFIYVGWYDWNAIQSVLQAYTFNGSTFTLVDSTTITSTNVLGGITGDGTYIYLGDLGSTLYAYSHTPGSGFTMLDSINTSGDSTFIYGLQCYDGHVYVTQNTNNVTYTNFNAYKFDGSSWSVAFSIPSPESLSSVDMPGISIVSLTADADNYYIYWATFAPNASTEYFLGFYSKVFTPNSQLNFATNVNITGNLNVGGTVNGVKKYVALINQTGTDDPVATVLENTLGTEVTWSRIGTGSYRGDCSAFVIGKTVSPQFPGFAFENNSTFILIANNQNQLGSINAYLSNPDAYVVIDTYDMVGMEEWSIIYGCSLFIEIRVYP